MNSRQDTKSLRTYKNKPWFTQNLRKLHNTKEEADSIGDQALYMQARNRLTKEINKAKRS